VVDPALAAPGSARALAVSAPITNATARLRRARGVLDLTIDMVSPCG
jgi:hypothetical protein